MVSMVTISAEDGPERLPAVSETRVVIACTPSASAVEVTVVVMLVPTSTSLAYKLPLAVPIGASVV